MRMLRHSTLAAVLLLSAVSPQALAADAADPWEGFNRAVFRFNETLDRYVTKPLAKGYQTVTPQVVDDAISRFFNNLSSPVTLVNQLLQGKPAAAAATTSRLIFNSTVGVGGLFDVAARMGVKREKEDFGQTLAVWGVKPGPYLVLPLLGPSTVRDTAGRVGDIASDPRVYMNDDFAMVLGFVEVVDVRADLLSVEKVIEGDRYNFIRDYYLQQREFAIADGRIEKDEFLDEDPSDEVSGDVSEPTAQ
ncbi:MlaA family lipoprotein [Perlucidibaca piscinae]|uniref:MlaA family lipoprotein n=1 Tax=Perlucidibaca piscinae TaxID=392589 RepID=UPI0003B74E82|nr:VacJ family lipoprotein [Perlucidibaca piscinae]